MSITPKKKHADHEAIAEKLRLNSPHWVLLDTASDRGRIANRAALWRDMRRCPRAFMLGGFEFRTRKIVRDDARPVFELEGRFIQ